MRVNLASFTGMHPLHLARELANAGVLAKYYSALPRFRIRGLPRTLVASHPALIAPHFLLRRAGLRTLDTRLIWTTTEAFDRWLCRTQGPSDVLHVLAGFGLRAIRRANAKGILTVCDRASSHIRFQDEILRDEFSRWGVAYPGIDSRFVTKEQAEYDEAALVVVPSRFARESFLQMGVDGRKVVAVPFGVSAQDFYPVTKRDDVFRVLCVASLTVRKGHGYLLEATTRLALPNSEVVLRGVSFPESRPILARYEGHFRLSAPVPRRISRDAVARERAELRDLYSQASVLVLASVEEGLAYVMGEAMACGVPVIATTNTGAMDLITDGKEGFIVPVRDVAAISDRLDYLYRHPEERAAMGRAAIEKARSLTWAQYARRMCDLYRDRLDGSQARSREATAS